MNKKKICVGIIVVLVAINVICYGIVFFNRKNKEMAKENTNEIPEEIDNTQIAENEETSINDEEINANIESEQTSDVQEETKQEETPEKKQETGQIQSSNVKSSTANSTKQTENNAPTETNKSQTAQAKQNEQTQASQTTSVQVPSVTTEENTKTTTNEEKYVRNDTMINRIKQVIQSNESEYMKNYGYEIVVDSSIKGQTNQFTFTETRVKSYLTYKFGTIRIYAEDYYNNGQLIMTECYIL